MWGSRSGSPLSFLCAAQPQIRNKRDMPVICGMSGVCIVPAQSGVAASRRQGCVADVRIDGRIRSVVPGPASADTDLGSEWFG